MRAVAPQHLRRSPHDRIPSNPALCFRPTDAGLVIGRNKAHRDRKGSDDDDGPAIVSAQLGHIFEDTPALRRLRGYLHLPGVLENQTFGNISFVGARKAEVPRSRIAQHTNVKTLPTPLTILVEKLVLESNLPKMSIECLDGRPELAPIMPVASDA